jgi:hypothetical protein
MWRVNAAVCKQGKGMLRPNYARLRAEAEVKVTNDERAQQ